MCLLWYTGSGNVSTSATVNIGKNLSVGKC